MDVEKGEVRRSYNEMGGRLYDLRYGEEQEGKFTAAFRRVPLSKNDLVLDVGCGTGLLLKKICGNVCFAVGLDISQELLSWSCLKLKGNQNIGLILSDAEHLPFKPAIFDKLFAITLLQNLLNPEGMLSDAMTVTRAEAVVIVSGLKKKYSKEKFKYLLNSVGLNIMEFVDEELKDFIAICEKKL